MKLFVAVGERDWKGMQLLDAEDNERAGQKDLRRRATKRQNVWLLKDRG